jgi:hypothetical protein
MLIPPSPIRIAALIPRVAKRDRLSLAPAPLR